MDGRPGNEDDESGGGEGRGEVMLAAVGEGRTCCLMVSQRCRDGDGGGPEDAVEFALLKSSGAGL